MKLLRRKVRCYRDLESKGFECSFQESHLRNRNNEEHHCTLGQLQCIYDRSYSRSHHLKTSSSGQTLFQTDVCKMCVTLRWLQINWQTVAHSSSCMGQSTTPLHSVLQSLHPNVPFSPWHVYSSQPRESGKIYMHLLRNKLK